MIQRIEPLRKKAQRIELFFFWIWLKELNSFFLNTTQRIEPFFECDSNWNFWLKISQKNSKLIFSHDPKNRTRFFSIWLKELNLFRLDSKIWCYSVWPKELNFFWLGLTELDPFLEYDSENWIFSWVFYMSTFFKNDAENWTLFSLNMTQRIEPFFLWMWRKELNPFFFECDVKNWNFFLEYDAKNWTLFLFEAKKRTFISLIWMTPRIVFSNKKYSMNWTFWNMTQRIEHLNHVSKRRLREWNSLKFFLKWLIELNLFFSFSRWLKELKSFFNMTQRIEPFVFLKTSQRIEYFFQKMLKELNLSFIWTTFLHDSMNWTFFNLTRRVESFQIWLKELDFFFFEYDSKIEPSFEYDSKKWSFLNMTQRSELFWTLLRESNPFFKTTQRIEPFSKSDSKNWLFSKWRKELKPFF